MKSKTAIIILVAIIILLMVAIWAYSKKKKDLPEFNGGGGGGGGSGSGDQWVEPDDGSSSEPFDDLLEPGGDSLGIGKASDKPVEPIKQQAPVHVSTGAKSLDPLVMQVK